jgi:hypothetical protein
MNGFTASAPFWHPAWAQGILFDWDGVLAETRLSFAPIYERFFGGRRVMLLEILPQLEERVRKDLEQALFDVEMEGSKGTTYPGASSPETVWSPWSAPRRSVAFLFRPSCSLGMWLR